MRTLLGVEVLEVGQVLEVVGVDAAVLNEGVGGDVVVDDLDLQCDTLLSQNVLDDLEDLGVGRGGRGDADGLAVQRAVVDGGVIAVGGVLHDRDDGTVILLIDVVDDLLALESGLQGEDLGGVLVALLDNQHVDIGGSGALDGQRILHGVQAGVDGIVAVDNGVVKVLEHVGQLRSLGLNDLDVVGILGDVVLGGGDADAVLELDDAVLLQQQQSTGLVGGVVGHADLNGRGGGLLIAAGNQTQSQHEGQRKGNQLGKVIVFHVDLLL